MISIFTQIIWVKIDIMISYHTHYLTLSCRSFASSQTAPRPLSSFDTHARWQPVTQSARSRRSYGKIGDCEQSSGKVIILHLYKQTYLVNNRQQNYRSPHSLMCLPNVKTSFTTENSLKSSVS